MRALLRPLAKHTVFSPIETIVAVFVAATLAYFHILDGIKHSSFFAPTFPSSLRPAHIRLSRGEWYPISEREWYNAWTHGEQALELQQIVFSVDDKSRKVCTPFVSLPAVPAVRSSAQPPRRVLARGTASDWRVGMQYRKLPRRQAQPVRHLHPCMMAIYGRCFASGLPSMASRCGKEGYL